MALEAAHLSAYMRYVLSTDVTSSRTVNAPLDIAEEEKDS